MDNQVRSSIKIHNLQTADELEAVRKLEALVWSVEESVPVTQTLAAVKNGGFILGAFLGDVLVGFQYSFPGFDGQKIYLYSHSLGIHPDCRRMGIGEMLKIAQKETALQKGHDLIKWTFDPLETVNGNLNLHKLGGSCSVYIEDAYGEIPDELNAGIPSDRFLVEWWIKRPGLSISEGSVDDIPSTIQTGYRNDCLVPGQIDLNCKNTNLLVPVPGNFQELKQKNFSLALDWRETTRMVFTNYISQGWIVIDLLKNPQQQDSFYYLMEKRVQGDSTDGN
ncbi:GNAT family N-acetyltransferase [Bacillus sp. Marseille-Q3570]|uniref:GNAT family N-acetyltransferase n=1 Tax=Bacillus sp. Marseille-Q3570 TaxID=2963522 RepID=UPI0021B788EA|nr:GNAT family N-acetyltransferase [Bacillus sp. Marseille-Q3570]